MEPTKAEAKKMQALFASSAGRGDVRDMIPKNKKRTPPSLFLLLFLSRTFLGVPAAEDSVHGRVKGSLGESDLFVQTSAIFSLCR